MAAYIAKRFLSMIPTLLGLTVLIFVMMRVIPGDAASGMLEDSPHARQKDELRAALGLDRPLVEQYALWITGLAQGDLGTSFWTNRPVLDEIRRAAPVTVELSVLATLVAGFIGIPIGIISAFRERTFWDYFGRSASILGLSVPNFWLATLALIFPAIWFGWVPPTEYRHIWSAPGHNLQQLALPALVIGTSASAALMRMTRSAMLEVLRQDYVRTARAKGLPERSVVLGHALKNAMIPVVTIFGTLVAGLLTGSIVVESVFNLPGFGTLIIKAISNRDYPLIQGSVLVFGVVYTTVNLCVDISYAYLNPRIRYG